MKRETDFVNLLIWAAVVAIAIMLIPNARAQAYDAAADFVPGENASNAWTWGWKYPGGKFTPMLPVPHDNCGIYKNGEGEIPGFDCFSAWSSGFPIPQVLKNNSGASVIFNPAGTSKSRMVLGQYALFLRLGYDPGTGALMIPVIRYTAQEKGQYDFLVSAQLMDKAAAGAVAHMTRQPDKPLATFGDGRHFQPTYTLKAGDSVDVWVTPVGNLLYATTAVRMSVMRK